MSTFFTSHHFTILTLFILFLKIQSFDPVSSFSFTDFGKDPRFKSIVGLYGNAKVVNGGSEVLLSGYENSGSGKIMYKKSIKLVEGGEPKTLVSFSTYFSFSMSLGDGNGLAFVMVPSGFQGEFFDNSSSGLSFGLKEKESKVIGVKFIASRDDGNESSASFSVAINVGSSIHVKTINISSVNTVIRNGGKLHAWIDYDSNSRRLEVRLSRYGHSKPVDPLLWQTINFFNLWKPEEMFAGFTSMKGKTSQACFLYSWSFIVRHFPHSVHSEPQDPNVFVAKNTESYSPPVTVKPRSDCLLRILAAMIFGTVCGALSAFTVLYLWTMFGNRRPVVPEECVMQPVDFEYKKVNIVVDKPLKDAKV
ncbi:L-type lectin-domain containing receptor kinase VIII.2 [Cicer arietinum]|uniref:L-type lectin-domain containing receptor kinase VIII.2 n=1 Tax=Cicer arietinum TaxID=3827 RepID=A0A1S2XRC3_CICAR|nr:L-type lectin-domain containing receptor kinase VIII.2 [Cicer arietinum]